MPDNEKGAKASLNPFYKNVPFVFKRTGEVRACDKRPRFSRKMSLMASAKAREVAGADSLTLTDTNTTYILSKAQTAWVFQADSAVEALVLNGWIVERTAVCHSHLVTDMYTQSEMEI